MVSIKFYTVIGPGYHRTTAIKYYTGIIFHGHEAMSQVFFIGMRNYLFRIKVKRRKENIVFVFKEWDLSSGRGGIL